MAGLSSLINLGESYLFGNNSSNNTGNSSDIQKALLTPWTFSRDFSIKSFKLNTSKSVGILSNKLQSDKSKLIDNTGELSDVVKFGILSIDTSDYNYEQLQEYIGGTWRYTTGRPNLRKLTVEFRDSYNGSVYHMFNQAMILLRNAYPDDQKWSINISVQDINALGDDVNITSASNLINGLANSAGLAVSKLAQQGINKLSSITKLGVPFPGVNSITTTGSSLVQGMRNNADSGNSYVVTTDTAILDSISSMRLTHSGTDELLTFSATFIYYNQ